MPNLGVVTAGETTFTVADVPGLIEGASEGRGLGHEFLRHVERCAALVHVVDTATMEPGRNPVDDLDVIENELSRYGGLEDRPRLVALNKVDVPDGRDLADIVVDDLREQGLRVFPVSARPRGRACASSPSRWPRSSQRRARPRPVAEATRIVLRPPSRRRRRRLHRDRDRATAGGCAAPSPSAGCGRPTSATTRRSGFLADRLNRLGVEARLVELGADEGDAVLIGDPDDAVVFDFKPGIDAGAEILAPPRRGPALRREAPGRPPSPRDRGGAWTTGPRARPAPTSPAGSTALDSGGPAARRRTRSAPPGRPAMRR